MSQNQEIEPVGVVKRCGVEYGMMRDGKMVEIDGDGVGAAPHERRASPSSYYQAESRTFRNHTSPSPATITHTFARRAHARSSSFDGRRQLG